MVYVEIVIFQLMWRYYFIFIMILGWAFPKNKKPLLRTLIEFQGGTCQNSIEKRGH